MLTTAHFENAAPILQDLDLGLLLETQGKAAAGDTEALAALIKVLAAGGKARAFRKLAAIAAASVDEILEAETDPAKLRALERVQAVRPFLDVLQEAVGFFSALVPMSEGDPGSLNLPGAEPPAGTPAAPDGIPSAAS